MPDTRLLLNYIVLVSMHLVLEVAVLHMPLGCCHANCLYLTTLYLHHALLCLLAAPHVLSLRERISIDAEPISTADFDDLVKQQEQTLLRCRDQEASALSHFEVMTALAYKALPAASGAHAVPC